MLGEEDLVDVEDQSSILFRIVELFEDTLRSGRVLLLARIDDWLN